MQVYYIGVYTEQKKQIGKSSCSYIDLDGLSLWHIDKHGVLLTARERERERERARERERGRERENERD